VKSVALPLFFIAALKFSGTLLDERGGAMKGPMGVTFALYTEQSGGAALWLETQNVKPDENGNYSILLGAASAKGIPQELFVSGDARWLGVQVEGRAEQARVLLVSVPYALKAGDAETLGGLPPSAFAQAHTSLAEPSSTAPSSSLLFPVAAASTASVNASSDPNVTTAGGTVNFIPKFDTPSDIKTSQIFDNGTNVGIGFPLTPTPVPVAKLDINGKANVITVPDVIGNLPLCLNIAGRLLRTLGWPWQRDLYARTFRWAGSSPSSGHGVAGRSIQECGQLFVFGSRRGHRLKILVWDRRVGYSRQIVTAKGVDSVSNRPSIIDNDGSSHEGVFL